MVGPIGNSGRGGSNSGRIGRVILRMKKLLDSSRTGQQEGHYRSLVREINRRHGYERAKLLSLSSPAELKAFITAEIKLFFSPHLIELANQNSLSPLGEIASRETRTLYIPKRGASKIFVSGQPPAETIEIFEAEAEQLSIDTHDLPPGFESVIVLPLVSSLAIKQPLGQYPRHGAIIVAKSPANAFDLNVDLRVLRMIANDLAIALVKTGQSL